MDLKGCAFCTRNISRGSDRPRSQGASIKALTPPETMKGIITGDVINGWTLTIWEPAELTEDRVWPFHFKMRWKVDQIGEAIDIVRDLESRNEVEVTLVKPKNKENAIAA